MPGMSRPPRSSRYQYTSSPEKVPSSSRRRRSRLILGSREVSITLSTWRPSAVTALQAMKVVSTRCSHCRPALAGRVGQGGASCDHAEVEASRRQAAIKVFMRCPLGWSPGRRSASLPNTATGLRPRSFPCCPRCRLPCSPGNGPTLAHAAPQNNAAGSGSAHARQGKRVARRAGPPSAGFSCVPAPASRTACRRSGHPAPGPARTATAGRWRRARRTPRRRSSVPGSRTCW